MIWFMLGFGLFVLAYSAYLVRKSYKDIDDIVKSVDSLIARERKNANDRL